MARSISPVKSCSTIGARGAGRTASSKIQEGRLYVAGGLNKPNLPFEPAKDKKAGIYVFTPEGKLLTFLPVRAMR